MGENKQVVIIGAGISGLICALELERSGYAPLVIEQSDRVGGRVKTDLMDGHLLDHGFQVLLTEYPAAKEYLDLDALNLKRFLPGAIIFRHGKPYKFGDPLRDATFLLPTMLSSIGTLKDKMIVHQLAKRLRQTDLEEIFNREEVTTMEYLISCGFSETIISHFLRPFFAGIFLEPELRTSSRMFEFVYKMFATGYAAIPEKGMHAIPAQLKSRLKKTTFRFNTHVKDIDQGRIHLDGGEVIAADHIVIASGPGSPDQKTSASQDIAWKSSQTLYFKADSTILKAPIIGLIPDKSSLVNHFHYVTDLLGSGHGHLLSATIVRDHDFTGEELIEQAKADLSKHANTGSLEFIKSYVIPRSLPDVRNIRYSPDPEAMRLDGSTTLCGDYLANGSLNGAMESGRVAAEIVAGRLKKG